LLGTGENWKINFFNVNLLLLQMGDSDMTGSSSDNPESESLSWIADQMDWDFESDETNPAIILGSPPNSKDSEVRLEQDNKDEISEAESAIRNAPTTVDRGILPSNEMNPEGRIFFGGIWWNSSWVEDMDLYDDNENWRCDYDTVLEEEGEDLGEENLEEEEDPEEEDPEEDDPEELNHGGEDPEEEENNKEDESEGDSGEESSSGSNRTP